MPSAHSRQRQSFQPCGYHAYNPHGSRWKLGCEGHEQPIRRHVSTSSFQLGNTRYAADHAHLSQPTDAWRRGKALTTMLLAVKLMKPAFASKPAESLDSCAMVRLARSSEVTRIALAQRGAYRRSTHGEWPLADIVRPTCHRPCRLLRLADLRRFTMSVGRQYHSRSSASRD